MIKNERQLAATRIQIDRFERALNALRQLPPPQTPNDIALRQIELDGIEGQLYELQTEATEYEELKSGQVTSLALNSINDLPYALIAGRISSGMTQKELAGRLGIREQVIQRYEASDYAGASFARMRAVAEALNLSVREEVLLPYPLFSPAFPALDSILILSSSG
jgi:DNA-binding XRE family transcriptional regulator